jgi:hypothetical protein
MGIGWPRRVRRAALLGAGVLVLAACGVGTWETSSSPMPVRAIHAAVLPSGKVLLVAGSGNQYAAFQAGDFETSVWDPATNTFRSVTTPWDAFCAGHAQLADGRLLVAGGTTGYEQTLNGRFLGSPRAYVFDATAERYVRVANMSTARWYPTLLTLGDGSILTVAGQDSAGFLTHTAQRFTGTEWTPNVQPPTRDDSSGARHWWPMYPGLHLLADGDVFYSATHTFGGTPPPAIWDLDTNAMRAVGGLGDQEHLDHAMSVMLPPAQDQKVMVLGGGRDDGSISTARVAIADLDEPEPEFEDAPSLDVPKMYVSAVILPDRTVLETGGAQRFRNAGGNSYTFSAQIFDPTTNTWTKAKDHTVGRGYHSSAILLPDGRVATFGNNPANGTFELRIEIYSPDYLARGPRPTVTDAPTEMSYGGQHTITTSSSAPIRDVSLVRPMAVTHSVDGNQRLVDVPFTRGPGGRLQLSVTDDPDLAPPGWYMLFATDTTGVPSIASWVHLGASA